jgi:hypothetical protein
MLSQFYCYVREKKKKQILIVLPNHSSHIKKIMLIISPLLLSSFCNSQRVCNSGGAFVVIIVGKARTASMAGLEAK